MRTAELPPGGHEFDRGNERQAHVLGGIVLSAAIKHKIEHSHGSQLQKHAALQHGRRGEAGVFRRRTQPSKGLSAGHLFSNKFLPQRATACTRTRRLSALFDIQPVPCPIEATRL